MSASLPWPRLPALAVCSATSPPFGKKDVLQCADRPGDHEVDRDERGEQVGEATLRRLRPQNEEHEADDEQHEDTRSGKRRKGAHGEDRRGDPPAALTCALDQIERERQQHDEERAEGDGVLGRRVGTEARDPRSSLPTASPTLSSGISRRDVVEDVVLGPRLDDRSSGHDGAAGDDHLHEQVDVRPRPNNADDEVEDEQEADEERQRLRDLGLEALTRVEFAMTEPKTPAVEEQQWPLEPRAAQSSRGDRPAATRPSR